MMTDDALELFRDTKGIGNNILIQRIETLVQELRNSYKDLVVLRTLNERAEKAHATMHANLTQAQERGTTLMLENQGHRGMIRALKLELMAARKEYAEQYLAMEQQTRNMSRMIDELRSNQKVV